jgi:hypothetical protein
MRQIPLHAIIPICLDARELFGEMWIAQGSYTLSPVGCHYKNGAAKCHSDRAYKMEVDFWFV